MHRPPQKLCELLRIQLKSVLLLGVFLSCGLGSLLIQVVGWATMLPDQYQQTGSVSQAIENTFDGNHPCQFCITAERLRETQEEQTPDRQREAPKTDFVKNLLSEERKRITLSNTPSTFLGYRQSDSLLPVKQDSTPESPPPELSFLV